MDKIYIKLLAEFAKKNKERITKETIIAFEFNFLRERVATSAIKDTNPDVCEGIVKLIERCEKNVGFFLTNPDKIEDVISEASVIP